MYGYRSRVARVPLAGSPWTWSVCYPTQLGCIRRQGREYNMKKYRNYWAYSIACFLVWGIILAVRAVAFGNSSTTHDVLFVFCRLVHCVGFGHHRQVDLTLHRNAGSSRPRVRPLPEPSERTSGSADGMASVLARKCCYTGRQLPRALPAVRQILVQSTILCRPP